MRTDLPPLPEPRESGAARRAALLAVALVFGTASAIDGLAPRAFAQAPAPTAAPRPVATQGNEDNLTQAQLEQLLAPVALYPDDLLMQMLMAATYPLEVVQAKRWLGQGQNASLQGDALAQALNAQAWDPAVKSLVPFPDVLTMMNDQLEWTQQVGDAVLAQQQDVMNAIQVLRGRAQANGALQSGPQQTVNVTQNVNPAPAASGAAVAPPPQVITIAPTQPDTVYVPAYDPNVVYGSWPYPQYPPTYYPPPVGWGVGNAILTGMAFAGGAAVVGSLWGWGGANWGRGDININANRYNNINVNRRQISGNTWQHDVSHRHGVAYRNDSVRNRVNADRPGGTRTAGRAQARDQFRGRMDQAERGGGLGGRTPGQRPGGDRGRPGDRGPDAGQRPGGGDRPALGDRRPGGGDRANLADRGGGQRPGGGERPNAGNRAGQARPQVGHHASGRPQPRPAAQQRQVPQGFQGMGGGAHERAAAQRGAASRHGQPAARQAAQHRAASRPAGGGGGHRAAPRGGGHRGRR